MTVIRPSRLERDGLRRYRRPALTIAGSGTVLPLSFFSMSQIRRQCLACGWRFRTLGWRRSRG